MVSTPVPCRGSPRPFDQAGGRGFSCISRVPHPPLRGNSRRKKRSSNPLLRERGVPHAVGSGRRPGEGPEPTIRKSKETCGLVLITHEPAHLTRRGRGEHD